MGLLRYPKLDCFTGSLYAHTGIFAIPKEVYWLWPSSVSITETSSFM